MTLTLNLPPDIIRRLAEKAASEGQTLEAYLAKMAGDDTAAKNGTVTAPELTDEEFEHLLDELSAGPTLPVLPPDFSRADIYSDHD